MMLAEVLSDRILDKSILMSSFAKGGINERGSSLGTEGDAQPPEDWNQHDGRLFHPQIIPRIDAFGKPSRAVSHCVGLAISPFSP